MTTNVRLIEPWTKGASQSQDKKIVGEIYLKAQEERERMISFHCKHTVIITNVVIRADQLIIVMIVEDLITFF